MGILFPRISWRRWSVVALALFSLTIAPVYAPVLAAPTCDADGDGYLKGNRKCGGNDCDDGNPMVNPGATEICDNGIDDNCSGTVDEGCGGGGGGGDPMVCEDGPAAGAQCTSNLDCGVCISGDAIGAACASNNDCPPNSGKGSRYPSRLNDSICSGVSVWAVSGFAGRNDKSRSSAAISSGVRSVFFDMS